MEDNIPFGYEDNGMSKMFRGVRHIKNKDPFKKQRAEKAQEWQKNKEQLTVNEADIIMNEIRISQEHINENALKRMKDGILEKNK